MLITRTASRQARIDGIGSCSYDKLAGWRHRLTGLQWHTQHPEADASFPTPTHAVVFFLFCSIVMMSKGGLRRVGGKRKAKGGECVGWKKGTKCARNRLRFIYSRAAKRNSHTHWSIHPYYLTSLSPHRFVRVIFHSRFDSLSLASSHIRQSVRYQPTSYHVEFHHAISHLLFFPLTLSFPTIFISISFQLFVFCFKIKSWSWLSFAVCSSSSRSVVSPVSLIVIQ